MIISLHDSSDFIQDDGDDHIILQHDFYDNQDDIILHLVITKSINGKTVILR